MGFGIKTKLKRRNLEKRKEKSRDAARTRRSRETEIFSSLSKEIPISFSLLSQMDKASVIRLAITHLKIRKFCEHVLDRKKAVQTFPSVELENKLNKLYYKALNGFVMVLSNTGNLIFITESILHHLGLSQVDLLGHSVFDFIHPCDHSELRDICGINKSNSSSDVTKSLSAISSVPSLSLQGDKHKKNFFIRMRCIHPCKGRSLSLKTNAYKVIHCSGFLIPCAPSLCHTASLKYSQEDVSFLVVECDSILHPSNHNIRLDSRSFISHHTMDMKFIYCDDGIFSLLGYSPEQLIGTCLYEFHHALDNNTIMCAYKTLFSKGQSVTGLYRFLAKSGGYAWVETQASLVKNPQTDKPQSVICINSVVTGILCPEEILGVVQQPIFKSLSSLEDSRNEHLKQMNSDCDSKIESKQCLYDNLLVPEVSISNNYEGHEDDIDNDCEPELEAKVNDVILSNDKLDVTGVMFATERILNSAKSLDDEKLVCPMENEMQPFVDSLQSSEGDYNTVDAGLPNVSSSASLFKLLKEFDDDGDEMRAPFIPMDDLIFVNNTSDGPLLTSIEDYDFPIFATENISFGDISDEVSVDTVPCAESLAMAPLKDDCEAQELLHHDIPTSLKNKGRAKRQASLKEEEEIEDGIQSPSVLKNLLLKGEDTNYGYRLMTGNQDLKHEKVNAGTSKVSALYQLLCS